MKSRSYVACIVPGVTAALLIAMGTCPRAHAQQPSPVETTGPRSDRGEPAMIADASQPVRPRLHLAKMEAVGSSAFRGRLIPELQLSIREELAADAAFQSFLEHLTGVGPHRNYLLKLAHSATQLRKAPNRFLCRLTGADRARINLGKKRVSLSWYVSFD